MKKYKIGDTVYLKAFVANVDKSDPEKTYGVNFVRGNYVIQAWPDREAIIDELPTAEPVKPVLPKNVADELIEAKTFGYNFLGYMNVALDNEYPSTNMFSFDGDDVHVNKKIKTLSDAWYNGYTVEQEPRYKVYVTGTNKQFMYLKCGGRAKVDNKKATPITPQSIGNYITAGGNRDLYWFTDEEITKFDLQDCEKELVADD